MRDQTDDMPAAPEGMSRTAKVGGAVLLTLLFTGALSFLYLMSSLPRIEGHIPARGIELPASIARNKQGVPHITARSLRDAYFALGWAHAQDRLWQMELQRRVAAGRLAEVVGPKGLASDRFMRTLGLYRAAEAGEAALDKPTRDALAAYAQGVNTWIDDHRLQLPPEFLLLGHRPEHWQPADSLAWGRLMGLQLAGNWRDGILRAKLAGRLDAQALGDLFPAYPADAPVTLASATADGLLAAIPPAAQPHLASNVWVVGGQHTASGKPLLANDPHLPFQAPVLWYLASIEAPGLSVAGATVPGVPFHLLGHNQRIAWGATATHADIVDLFVEKLTEDGTATLGPDGPHPIARRDEVIKVKDGPDVVLTVRTTRHGPVVSDLLASGLAGQGEVVALSGTMLEPDDLTAQAFYHLDRAVDWRSFLAAAKDFGAPVQNLAYADTAGHIGFVTAGRVPLRRGGGAGGMPARGWTGQGDWTGWIPFARMPQTYDPKSGIVVNANNRVTPDGYPYPITANWPDGYRARRILDLLAGRKGLTRDDMAAMQMDTLSLAAVELKDLAAGLAPGTALAAQAAKMIAAWDGNAAPDRPEPLIFAAWTDRLWHDLLAPRLGEDLPAFGGVRPAVLKTILARPRPWCGQDSCAEPAARSLEAAMTELAGRFGPDPGLWRWDRAHRARFANPVLGRVPLISSLANLEVGTGGDDFTINRGSYVDDGKGGFVQVHGPGLRAVYDLADMGQSRFVIATGQSGNMLSRHYGDLLPAWRDNAGMTLARPSVAAIILLEPSY